MAREAVVGIEVVVPAVVGDEVFAVDRTAEPLKGVVVRVAHLHVVYLRGVAHRTEGYAVYFLVHVEREAGKLHAYVAQHARVVVCVGAAVLRARPALNLRLAGVVGSLSAEDYTAPVAGLALSLGLCRGKHDGFCGRALGNKLAAAFGNERGLGLLVALDDGTRLNGEFRAVGNVHPALERVNALLQGLLARKHKLLVAVANLVAVEKQVVGRLESAVGTPLA